MPTIAMNYDTAIKIIDKLNDKDKQRVADYVNELTFSQWFADFRKRMSKTSVNIDEINSLVEEVRTGNYDSSH